VRRFEEEGNVADKSIIIIGAGLAGLATGCYAQMNGYRSQIFEHHGQPGGVAAAWKRKDYLVDGGIHFLMGHRPGQSLYDLYSELGTAQANRFLDMHEYGEFLDEVSGRRVLVTADLDRLAADLKALSPADAGAVDELIAGARAFQAAGTFDIGFGDPPELMGPLGMLKQFWGMRRVYKYFSGKYARPVSEWVQAVRDPWLRQMIENLFMPDVPVWFVLMILALLADRQMGLLEGGSGEFVRPIEQRYRDLGGQITYHATVEEILVETRPACTRAAGTGERSRRDDRAVGVRLADPTGTLRSGSQHRADVIVSAADGYSTIFQMLGGRYVDEKIRARYRDWKLIRPCVMISYGVAREFRGDPHIRVFILKQPFDVGGQAISGFFLRIFNYSARFAPPGKTVIQATFETDWDYWNTLHTDAARYQAEKERVAAEVLARLEAHYPGLAAQVEVTDVATPYTTWRYTLNRRGAYEGWLPTPEVLTTTLPRTLPGLANFYMAGQWVIPGGGVPTCLNSGRDVVRILCRRDGKPFVTSRPGQ
jgi:phytoene dehydrogenase-like protein